MRRLSASLLIILASASTFAQVSPTTFTLRSSDSAGCPVGFFASRQATGQIMSAGDTRQTNPAQGLHLKLNHLMPAPAIESIEVTVYGTSPRARVLPLAQKASDTVSKTFELRRTGDNTSLTDADVWMHQVGSLTSVDLISIAYADGTTWRATANLRCRAVPSNYLLVGSK